MLGFSVKCKPTALQGEDPGIKLFFSTRIDIYDKAILADEKCISGGNCKWPGEMDSCHVVLISFRTLDSILIVYPSGLSPYPNPAVESSSSLLSLAKNGVIAGGCFSPALASLPGSKPRYISATSLQNRIKPPTPAMIRARQNEYTGTLVVDLVGRPRKMCPKE